MNFSKLLDNLKHAPTTIAGAAVSVSAALQLPVVQQAAALDPHVAAVISKVGAVAGGLYLIFGTGSQSQK